MCALYTRDKNCSFLAQRGSFSTRLMRGFISERTRTHTHTRCIHKVHSQLLHAVDVTEIRTLHLRLIDRDSVDLGRDTDTALIFF